MSYQLLRTVLERSRSRNASRVVLLVLAERSGLDGISYPSIGLLAREANVSRSALHLALSRLVNLGEIAIGYNAGPKGCNVYRLLLPLPETGPLPETQQGGTGNATKGVPETGPEPSGNHKEPSVINKQGRATLDECRAFARKAELPESDGESFFHDKEERNWCNGLQPIRDAKAVFVNWARKGFHPSQKAAVQPKNNVRREHQRPVIIPTKYDF